MSLVEAHLEARFKIAIPCPTLPYGWSAGRLTAMWWRSQLFPAPEFDVLDPRPGGIPEPPRPWLFVESASKRFDSLLLLPREGDEWQALTVVSAGDSWVLSSSGSAAFLRKEPAAEEGPVFDAAAEEAAEIGLDMRMLWVEQAEAPRWALFNLRTSAEETAVVRIVAEGKLPTSLGTSAELVNDRLGRTAALVNASEGTIIAFDSSLRSWIESAGDSSWLRGRRDASYALIGPKLFVAGGGSNLSSDSAMKVVDIFGGEQETVGGLPFRIEQRLELSDDGTALLLYGGKDELGLYHDDVWSISFDSPFLSSRLVRPDTTLAPRAPSVSVVAGSSDGRNLRLFSLRDADAPSIESLARTDFGWTQVDAFGEPTTPVCSTGDHHGGELCSVGNQDWWASVGLRACGQGMPNCQTSRSEASAHATISAHAIAAVARSDGAWVLTPGSLERWYADEGMSPTLLHRHLLPAGGRDFSFGEGIGLLATEDGLHAVVPSAEGMAVSNPTLACGRPLRLVHLGHGRFAVNTTLGLALVSVDEQGAYLESMTALFQSQGQGLQVPLATDAETIAMCAELDQLLPAWTLDTLARYSPVATLGPRRILAARTGVLFDLDDTAEAMSLRGTHVVPFLAALRGDEVSQRAYGMVQRGKSVSYPLFDGRYPGAVKRRGTHNVGRWVARSEASRVRSRLSDESVELVWVNE